MGSAELSQRYSDHGMMWCLGIVHDEADVHALTNSLSAYRLQPARPLSTFSLPAIFTNLSCIVAALAFLASSASRRCRARSIFAARCISARFAACNTYSETRTTARGTRPKLGKSLISSIAGP